MSALNGFIEANTPRRPEMKFHTVTKTGRKCYTPKHLQKDHTMVAKTNPYAMLGDESDDEDEETNIEIAAVGAGTLLRTVKSTAELKPLKYKQAMKTEDKEEWMKATKKEYHRFDDRKVFKVVDESDVPPGTRPMTSTWSCKKKAKGVFRARLNIRGYEQVPGEHYDEDWTSAPVSNDVTIRLMLCILLISGMYAHIVDVQGAFLLGTFENNEQIYCDVPEGWEEYFKQGVLLLLLKTVYGLKQAANCFYNLLVHTMRNLDFNKSRAEPAMFYKWHPVHGIIVWLS